MIALPARGRANRGENMNRTAQKVSETTTAAIIAALATKKAAYKGDAAAEGKQKAIESFGFLITGQSTAEEFQEIACSIEAGLTSANKGNVEYAKSYSATIALLTAAL